MSVTPVLTTEDARQAFHEWYPVPTRDCPTYAVLAAAIGNRPAVAELLLCAPVEQRLPVLLFACVHALLLDHSDDPLARWYRNLGGTAEPDTDLIVAFERFVTNHDGELRQLLARRATQTNEIGRCAALLPALQHVADGVDAPLAHLDVGASGGLNLLWPYYGYRYHHLDQPHLGATATAGAADATVILDCTVRTPLPFGATLPSVTRSIGLDREPIDVTDADAARWLQACIWPDQVERFTRLKAALALAAAVGVEVVAGDAVTDTAAIVAGLAEHGHPVITDSWVLNYLSPSERGAFVEQLETLGAERDCSWIWMEHPALCAELPGASGDAGPNSPTAVVAVTWRNGRRHVAHLADAHPHGRWIDWLT